jgi:hypothetical protein
VFDFEFVLDKKEHRITCVDVSDNHIVLGNKGGHLMPYETQYMKVKDVSYFELVDVVNRKKAEHI